MQKRKKIINIISSILMILVFIVVAAWVVLVAAGYKIEIKNKRLVQTSLIAVKADPRDSTLYIDGASQIGGSPWRVPNIVPGNHFIEVRKVGYTNWSENVQLKPGETAIVEEPMLFLQVPIAKTLSDNEQSSLFVKIENIEQDPRINIVDGSELKVDRRLVTRLSTDIIQPRFYQDENHLAFISGGWLHIIDIDGLNDYTPTKMANTDNYLFVDKGNTLIVKRGDKLESIKIR